MSAKVMPDRWEIASVLATAISTLEEASATIRPTDFRGRPGGLVYLPEGDYVVIVPDLHARGDFLRTVYASRFPFGGARVADDLASGRATVVCVGDAFHAEARARERWNVAYREFLNGYSSSPAMDEEMAESLDTMCEVARLQSQHPLRFHFLKGNHENIANERKEGNYPFRKFAYEGHMVREWVLRMLGEEVYGLIYRWEKALPLAAAGDRFLVTHAEPARTYDPQDIVDAYMSPETIAGLTWTGNDEAMNGSVPGTLSAFFPGAARSFIFGGHRPVPDRYALRQRGRYVQINTPARWVVAAFRTIDQFDPASSIVDLGTVERT